MSQHHPFLPTPAPCGSCPSLQNEGNLEITKGTWLLPGSLPPGRTPQGTFGHWRNLSGFGSIQALLALEKVLALGIHRQPSILPPSLREV